MFDVYLAVHAASHGPTLASSCGPTPDVACRLVWDLTHNGRSATLTKDFLATPAHVLFQIAYTAVLALLIRALAHRVISRLSVRAEKSLLSRFRGGTAAALLVPGRLKSGRRKTGRRRSGRRRSGWQAAGWQAGPEGGAEVAPPGGMRPDPGAPFAASAAPPAAPEWNRNGQQAAGPGRQAEFNGAAARAERALVDERRKQRVGALNSILNSAASVTIFSIAGVLILGDLGINLAPLLASAGVVGIAIGFGAQNLVRDYLSGIFMLIEDQYGVGDVITVGAVTGAVETVTLRITRLRDINGIVWHIRNGTIEQVGNESQGWARAVIDFPVPYEADLATIRAVLTQAAQAVWDDPSWRSMMLEVPEVWGAQAVSSTEVTMRIVVKTPPLRQWEVEREMRARMKAALASAALSGGLKAD